MNIWDLRISRYFLNERRDKKDISGSCRGPRWSGTEGKVAEHAYMMKNSEWRAQRSQTGAWVYRAPYVIRRCLHFPPASIKELTSLHWDVTLQDRLHVLREITFGGFAVAQARDVRLLYQEGTDSENMKEVLHLETSQVCQWTKIQDGYKESDLQYQKYRFSNSFNTDQIQRLCKYLGYSKELEKKGLCPQCDYMLVADINE